MSPIPTYLSVDGSTSSQEEIVKIIVEIELNNEWQKTIIELHNNYALGNH